MGPICLNSLSSISIEQIITFKLCFISQFKCNDERSPRINCDLSQGRIQEFILGGQTMVPNRKLRAKPESRARSTRVSRAKPESRARSTRVSRAKPESRARSARELRAKPEPRAKLEKKRGEGSGEGAR